MCYSVLVRQSKVRKLRAAISTLCFEQVSGKNMPLPMRELNFPSIIYILGESLPLMKFRGISQIECSRCHDVVPLGPAFYQRSSIAIIPGIYDSIRTDGYPAGHLITGVIRSVRFSASPGYIPAPRLRRSAGGLCIRLECLSNDGSLTRL